MVECRTVNSDVAGSIPARPAKRVLHNGSAPSFQVGCASSILVTRSRPHRPWVRIPGFHLGEQGSSPCGATKFDIIVLYLPNGGTLTYSLERGITW
jgi:hypothetical protein